MSSKAIMMFTLLNLHSRKKYYRKEFSLMTIYKFAKIFLTKRVVVIPTLLKKLYIRHITVLNVGKRRMKLVKSQINHNKTKKTEHHI